MESLLLTKSLGNLTINLNGKQIPVHLSYKVWENYSESYDKAVGDCKDLIQKLEKGELLIATIELEASIYLSETHSLKESDTLGSCIIKSSLDHREITDLIQDYRLSENAIEGLRDRLNDLLNLLK
jgi:Mor family transcriptional regulator